MSNTRTQLVVQPNKITTSIGSKFGGSLPLDKSAIEVVVSFCIGYYPDDAPQVSQNKALVEAAIKEGFNSTVFLAGESEEAVQDFKLKNDDYLAGLKLKGVKVVSVFDWFQSSEYRDAKVNFAKMQADQKEVAEKDLKIDITQYAKRKNLDINVDEESEEKQHIKAHILRDAEIVTSWMTKESRVVNKDKYKPTKLTVYVHENFTVTMNKAIQSAGAMGYQSKSVQLVKADKRFFATKVVEDVKTVKPEFGEKSYGAEVSVPFDALSALVEMGKGAVEADWAVNVIKGTHVQFDALSAMIKLGKEGVDPAWAAYVLCGIFFGNLTPSKDLEVLIERQPDVNEATGQVVKVTLAKDQVAMQSMSSKFDQVNLESLSSDPATRDALSKELANALRSEVHKRMEPIPAVKALVILGQAKIDAAWSAAFLKVYSILMNLYHTPVASMNVANEALIDLKEMRVETQEGRAKLTLASSQNAMDVMTGGSFEQVLQQKVFEAEKAPPSTHSAMFSIAPTRAQVEGQPANVPAVKLTA